MFATKFINFAHDSLIKQLRNENGLKIVLTMSAKGAKEL